VAEKQNPGALAGATGAGLPCHATAAGPRNITQSIGRAKHGGLYRITPEGGDPFTIYAEGREAWALDRLRAAGPKGCTPIDEPAPRWSAYVHTLRERGVPIVTIREAHGGDFAGHHGRYVLRATVQKGGAA
jgi:hypothetical protein